MATVFLPLLTIMLFFVLGLFSLGLNLIVRLLLCRFNLVFQIFFLLEVHLGSHLLLFLLLLRTQLPLLVVFVVTFFL